MQEGGDVPDGPVEDLKVVSIDDARKRIQEEKQLRENACLEEINNVLRRFQCSIDAVIEMRANSSGEYKTQVILRTVAV